MLLICFLLLLFCFASSTENGVGVFELNVCPSNEEKFENENLVFYYLKKSHNCVCNDNYFDNECKAKCDNNVCNSNGISSFVNGKCTCKCSGNYGGDNCNADQCKADTRDANYYDIICHPQGTETVEKKIDECKCNCKDGWSGKYCKNHKEIICENQCSKKGTSKVDLKDDDDQCICHCKPGYFGRGKQTSLGIQNDLYVDCNFHCVIDKDDHDAYCDKDGSETAEWTGGVCFCRCKKDYYGPRCASKCVGWGNPNCNEIGTESLYIEGDKCKCKCKEGYYGDDCSQACNNYNGDGRSNCLAEGTKSAQINDNKCICDCKEGFYGETCLKCKVSNNNVDDRYCDTNSAVANVEGGVCVCTCRNNYYAGKRCEINCNEECGVQEGRADSATAKDGKCECNCGEEYENKYFNPKCNTKCSKGGAKGVETKCSWEGKCKDRFAGKKCDFDKYSGKPENPTSSGEDGNETTTTTGHIMGITVAVSGIFIIIIGVWI